MTEHHFLKELDSRTKLLSFFLLLAALLLTGTPEEFLAAVLILGILLFCAGAPPGKILLGIIRGWKFLLIVFLMNAFFFSDQEPILHWWIFSLTREGMRQGTLVVLHIVFVLVLTGVLMAVTRPVELTRGITSLLSPLRFLGLPVEEGALILSLAIQFIPGLIRETDQLKLAQAARGAEFESKNMLLRTKSFLSLLLPLFLNSFRRADDLALAMEARGFRSARDRTPAEKQPYPLKEVWLPLAAALLMLGAILS